MLSARNTSAAHRAAMLASYSVQLAELERGISHDGGHAWVALKLQQKSLESLLDLYRSGDPTLDRLPLSHLRQRGLGKELVDSLLDKIAAGPEVSRRYGLHPGVQEVERARANLLARHRGTALELESPITGAGASVSPPGRQEPRPEQVRAVVASKADLALTTSGLVQTPVEVSSTLTVSELTIRAGELRAQARPLRADQLPQESIGPARGRLVAAFRVEVTEPLTVEGALQLSQVVRAAIDGRATGIRIEEDQR
ncbi:MAG: hypothetical protein IT384_34155 [Deltaproteobacteria bacterium]|nr:hypothetical protein [Deltaproteobacteria bacterium]